MVRENLPLKDNILSFRLSTVAVDLQSVCIFHHFMEFGRNLERTVALFCLTKKISVDHLFKVAEYHILLEGLRDFELC